MMVTNMEEAGRPFARIPSHVLSKRVQGETVVIDLDSGAYFGLDAVGTAIWERMLKHPSRDSLVDELTTEFASDRSGIRRDVDEFLALLESKGLVVLEEVDDR